MAALEADDAIWFGRDGTATPSRKTFLAELTRMGVVPATVWLYGEVGSNHEARNEAREFDADDPFTSPKPERLLQRILEIATNPGDLVLDSFLGSGTTAAVAHKLGRRWIGIEVGEHAVTHCLPRMEKVIAGEQGGISKAVEWHGGGGLRFFTLGPPVFDEDGRIRADIPFSHLAAHVWFAETGTPRPTRAKKNPFLGAHAGTGYYLLYNGVLGDQARSGGNVLTPKLLRELPPFDGPRVIYGEACTLSDERLRELDITFKQTPYDIKAR